MMSMMRITKTEAVCMMPYWGRLGCFVKGVLRMKELSKGWRWSWDCQNLMWGKQKCQIRIDYDWDGEEANFADSVLSFVKEYLFPCFKFLKDRWMEYDEGQDSFSTFVQGKVNIPEGAVYKDQWERVIVICPTIQVKYVTIRCNLNNEIWRTYKSKCIQMRKTFFQHY